MGNDLIIGTRSLAALRMLLAALIMVPLSGCDIIGLGEWKWHQKLTVSVQTPSGLKVASSVQQGHVGRSGWWLSLWGQGGGSGLTGEAVALEVAPGRYLFALLRGTPLAHHVFLPDVKDIERRMALLPSMRETRELQPKIYPTLVTFGDISDPASIKRVDPTNLEASFGAGYQLNSITMAVTDEPVTEGRLKEVAVWINDLSSYRRDPNNPFTNTLPDDIGYLRKR